MSAGSLRPEDTTVERGDDACSFAPVFIQKLSGLVPGAGYALITVVAVIASY